MQVLQCHTSYASFPVHPAVLLSSSSAQVRLRLSGDYIAALKCNQAELGTRLRNMTDRGPYSGSPFTQGLQCQESAEERSLHSVAPFPQSGVYTTLGRNGLVMPLSKLAS